MRFTLVLIAVLLLSAGAAAAGEAKGTVSYEGKIIEPKYAYFIKGPDVIEPGMTVRILILSAEDISEKIDSCDTVNCVDGWVKEGMTMQFETGPVVYYWVSLKGGTLQYSGATHKSVFRPTADTDGRLAGKIKFDDTPDGGGKADVEFDVNLTKEFGAAH
ncbi:MAG: hypothetical protein RIG61_00205 [Deltaproteobacteria bacterium]